MSEQCESFGCLPVAGGLVDQPFGILSDLGKVRAYKAAYRQVMEPVNPEKVPEWALERVNPVVEYIAVQDAAAMREGAPSP
jgi:hypothetical protein